MVFFLSSWLPDNTTGLSLHHYPPIKKATRKQILKEGNGPAWNVVGGKSTPKVAFNKEKFTQKSLWVLALHAHPGWLEVHHCSPLAYERLVNTSEEYVISLEASKISPRSYLKTYQYSNIMTLFTTGDIRGWLTSLSSHLSPIPATSNYLLEIPVVPGPTLDVEGMTGYFGLRIGHASRVTLCFVVVGNAGTLSGSVTGEETQKDSCLRIPRKAKWRN